MNEREGERFGEGEGRGEQREQSEWKHLENCGDLRVLQACVQEQGKSAVRALQFCLYLLPLRDLRGRTVSTEHAQIQRHKEEWILHAFKVALKTWHCY